MAAQVQQPTGRVALGVLDINLPSPATSTSNKHVQYPSNGAAFSESGPSLPLSPSISPIQQSEKSPLTGTKRKLGMLGPTADLPFEVRSAKHSGSKEASRYPAADDHIDQESGNQMPVEDSTVEPCVEETASRHDQQRESDQSSEGTPRESPSPSSTFDTTQDTQNTSITEPEDVATLAVTTSPLTPLTYSRGVTRQEARENAEALRLRLKLATYKVRTNQTDVPLSQLVVKTSDLVQNSTLRWTGETFVVSELPKLKVGISSVDIPSSPPTSKSQQKEVRSIDGLRSPPKRQDATQQHFTTPNLPKKRSINMQKDAAEENDSPGYLRRGENTQELTSSVIKGRAADGLLSLMGAYR